MPDIPSVAVLMSTYNGERFLREQLDSILSQGSVAVELIIRDDCSSDATPDIIRSYENRYGNVHAVTDGNRIGAANSFMQLLYHSVEVSDAAYFAFSDQDDIWKPDKLSTAVSAIGDHSMPALYCSNQIIYADGAERGLRYQEAPDLTIPAVLFRNQISGCTMVLTRVLAEELAAGRARPRPEVLAMRMHDTWVLLAALALGQVTYDPEGSIDYRIHSSNAVGTKDDEVASMRRNVRALSAARQGGTVRYRSAYAIELLRCFPDVNDADWDKVGKLARYRGGMKERVNLLFDKGMRSNSGMSVAEYAAKVLIGTL